MKTKSFLQLVKGAFIALVAFTLGSTAAQAQALRTWVSSVGDDANPCSRTAPCKTFAGAVSKLVAGGEIDCLDSGDFGPVTITKSITLEGAGVLGSILASGATRVTGVTINAPGAVVKLRNLSINGAVGLGFSTGTVISVTNPGTIGVRIQNASEVSIEDCTIFDFNQKGVEIATSTACRVTIKNTIIRHCVGGAVDAQTSAGGTAVNISKSSLNDSLFGFRAGDNVKAVLDDCVVAGNNKNGVITNNSGGAATKLMVGRCTINDTGGFGVLSSGANSSVFISKSVIFNNGTGVGTLNGGSVTSRGNNDILGNTTDGAPLPPIVPQN